MTELKKVNHGQAVLVTTSHRGVFFGYLETQDLLTGIVTLRQARNCLYWTKEVKGFLGLATAGPTATCRVGPAVPKLILTSVTSVATVTAPAIAAWEKAPWAI